MRVSPRGFTIVELLIVVVVIAILAAITIVAYNGIQGRTYDSSIQSDVTSIAKKLMANRTLSGDDTYQLSDVSAASNTVLLKVNKSAWATSPQTTANGLVCMTSDAKQMAVLALSRTGNRYMITGDGTTTLYTGAVSWVFSSDNGSNNGPLDNLCNAMLPGSGARGVVYRPADTVTGPWRPWAGGN